MKALSVCVCEECRNYINDCNELGIAYAYCKLARSKYSTEDGDIPEWCPLPDMPEVE